MNRGGYTFLSFIVFVVVLCELSFYLYNTHNIEFDELMIEFYVVAEIISECIPIYKVTVNVKNKSFVL